MLGSSRDSLAALRTSVDARSGEPGFGSVPADLLAVAGVLGREKSLRQALADAGQPVAVRAGLAVMRARVRFMSLKVRWAWTVRWPP